MGSNISSAADLQYLKENPGQWSGSWTQTANIDMAGCSWDTGIGTGPTSSGLTPFAGTYDGGGYEISGLTVSSDSDYAGLFAYVTGTVTNAGFTGTVSTTSTGRPAVGGLIGANTGTVSNSYATGAVSVSARNKVAVGGLIGTNTGTVSNSYATGAVSVSVAGETAEAGGLVSANTGTITNSHATGTVSVISRQSNAGGLVGALRGSGSISGSYATGSVTAAGTDPNIRNWFSYAGGLVAVLAGGQIENSYATGNATAETTDQTYAGGLVAVRTGGNGVTKSYATGFATAEDAGGLIYGADGGFTASFYNILAKGNTVTGTGLTSDEFQDLNTFDEAGWDIGVDWSSSKIWGICSTFNDGYPFLTAIYSSQTCVSAPTSVAGRALDEGALISFTPGGDQGAAIKNYEYSIDGGSNWSAPSPAVTTSPVTIAGLTNGTTYSIQVRAINGNDLVGTASSSVDVIPVASNTPPGKPTDVKVTPGSASLDLSWTAPADEGGAPISDYEFTTGSDEWKSLSTTGTSATITTDSSDPGVSLVNGTEYTLQVRARNANGPSSASSSVSRIPGTPQAPAVSSETDWDQDSDTFTFSWNPPADNGDPVQFYQIAINQVTGRSLVLRMSRFGSGTYTTTSTSFTATGVSTNYSYTFTITPYNSNGFGEPSVISIQATTPGGKPPRGLIQQFGLPLDVTCEEAASPSLNWAGVPSGGWGMSWAQWMNGGLGGAVCTRMLNYSNAQGGWVLAP